jgi:ubiquinone/menaquinone biosynthesis C-methylase UbiE
LSTHDVRSVFDLRAADYQGKSESWPWSWLRRREARVFLEMIGAVRGLKALDLGCGAGFYTRLMLSQEARHVVAVDFSENMIRNLPRERVTGIVADAGQVTLDSKFERIVLAGILEFVDDPETIIANARRHAEVNASLVVLVPLANLWGLLYKAYHRRNGLRIKLFSKQEICRIAEHAGWQVGGFKTVWPFTLELIFTAVE